MIKDTIEFQEIYGKELHDEVFYANDEYIRRNKAQIVSLTAPTGSGKTVMMGTLIEDIMFGAHGYDSDPRAIVIWLSDSPDLNRQSMNKLMCMSDKIPTNRCIELNEGNTQAMKSLDYGHVYFLNTQKLGKGKGMVTIKEGREKTWWQILQSTIEEKGDHLYLVIDEAHRGAPDKKGEMTIMQKFLRSNPQEGLLNAVPVAIGISATIERFRKLAEKLNSSSRNVDIPIEEVRKSGLLKDNINLCHPGKSGMRGVWAMLEEAAADWQDKCKHWSDYCTKNNKPQVCPILVLQVENATGNNKVTNTDLKKCIETIERRTNVKFKDGEVVHAIDGAGIITINNLDIPYVNPEEIEANKNIKVVIFKEALVEGWDCPRAETMMSFRAAKDYTHIAQLVGRMVRTPMRCHIVSDETLNEVNLMLPHFDRETVENIVKWLKDNTAAGAQGKDMSKKETERLNISSNYKDVFSEINKMGLQRLRKSKKAKGDYLKLAFELAMLLQDETSSDAMERFSDAVSVTKEGVFDLISNYINGLKKSETYKARMKELCTLNVVKQVMDAYEIRVRDYDVHFRDSSYTREDIDWAFTLSERALHSYGICQGYVGKYCEPGNIDMLYQLRLDVILFVSSQECQEQLQRFAKERYMELKDDSRCYILGEDSKIIGRYNQLCDDGNKVYSESFGLSETIYVTKSKENCLYENHLYLNDSDEFSATLNELEKKVLEEEIQKDDFVCWLRNQQQAVWALSSVYEMNNEKHEMYPDFIIVRKNGDKYILDVLEPHWKTGDDNLAKAKGLINLFDKNKQLGRVELIRQIDDKVVRIDVAKSINRDKIQLMSNCEDLTNLFLKYARS